MESINIEDTNLVNLTEASRRLGIGYATLWRWTKKGKVTPVRILGLPYLTIEQIESLKNEKNNKRLRGTSGLEEDSNILKVNEAMEINLVKLNSSHVTELVRRLNSMSSQDKFFFTPHQFDQDTINNLLDSDNHYYILNGAHGEMLGYGMLRNKFEDGVFPNPTLGVVIWSEYRGRGYGSKLVNLLLSQTSEIGFSNVKLKVHKKNRVAFNIYRKVGFRKIGDVNEGQIWMQHDLESKDTADK